MIQKVQIRFAARSVGLVLAAGTALGSFALGAPQTALPLGESGAAPVRAKVAAETLLGATPLARAYGEASLKVVFSEAQQVISETPIVAGRRVASERGTTLLAMAAGHLDPDGVIDLVVGHATTGGGTITRMLGNLDVRRSRAERQAIRELEGREVPPFLDPALIIELKIAPDFVATGDLDGDSHVDVVAAARGGRELAVLRGDGNGGLGEAVMLPLPGTVTAFTSGEVNRPDGLVDLVVAVERIDGASLLVFAAPNGALNHPPEEIPVSAVVDHLAVGSLSRPPMGDVVAAAGSRLLVVTGRDRRLSWNRAAREAVPAPSVASTVVSGKVVAITTADLMHDAVPELAALTEDGIVWVLAADGSGHLGAPMMLEGGTAPTGAGSPALLGLHTSGAAKEDLLVWRRQAREATLLVTQHRTGSKAALSLHRAARLETTAGLTAVLPLCLDGDGMHDLVLGMEGVPGLAVMMRRANLTYKVHTTSCASDNGICYDIGTPLVDTCSLCEAIDAANSNSGYDTIIFDPGLVGTSAIQAPAGGFPDITDTVHIDGVQSVTEPSPDTWLTEIDGTLDTGDGLTVTASTSTLTGLVVNRFAGSGIVLMGDVNTVRRCIVGLDRGGSTTLGNGADGVRIDHSSYNLIGGTATVDRNVLSANLNAGVGVHAASHSDAIGNDIAGNYIGTDITGSSARGNIYGVELRGGSGTEVGVSGYGNVISGNSSNGIDIGLLEYGDQPATLTSVVGNLIGTDAAGNLPLGNTGRGVHVHYQTTDTSIGGGTAAHRNVVSANGLSGLDLEAWAQVQGNYVGTNLTGSSDLGNLHEGVFSMLPFGVVVIGGTAAGTGNVISGNELSGVSLSGGTLAHQILGNLIGTDAAGSAAIPNSANGVELTSGDGSSIGGAEAGAANVISGNTGAGILISASDCSVLGNLIGTDASGTGSLGNGGDGISRDSLSGLDCVIGGCGAAEGNTIAHNGGAGVSVISAAAGGLNPIRCNSIHSNAGLGIDLGDDGVTANDAGDGDTGPNSLQNHPVLTAVTREGGSVRIQGSLNSLAGQQYTIDFYSNPTCDASGYGEGQAYLGSVVAVTNASGNAFFDTTLPVAVSYGHVVTATANSPFTGDYAGTSELSACITVPGADIFTDGFESGDTSHWSISVPSP